MSCDGGDLFKALLKHEYTERGVSCEKQRPNMRLQEPQRLSTIFHDRHTVLPHSPIWPWNKNVQSLRCLSEFYAENNGGDGVSWTVSQCFRNGGASRSDSLPRLLLTIKACKRMHTNGNVDTRLIPLDILIQISWEEIWWKESYKLWSNKENACIFFTTWVIEMNLD